MRLTFLGATNTVTGSRFLLEAGGLRLLVDCGLFQGYKYLRERNWAPLPVDPASIDAVILTHAHLDHSGYLPRLVRQGFSGPVYCSRGTRELCALLLPDSGYLQEEEAAFLNRIGASRHHPAQPLYTRQEAEAALSAYRECPFGESRSHGDVSFGFLRSGHLIGGSLVWVESEGVRIVFSGDVGRPADLLMRPPEALPPCDYLVLEATYGDRLHSSEDPGTQLAELIPRVAGRSGMLLVPSFAVGRAQLMIYLLVDLMERGLIPELPIYLDSPMAVNASRTFCAHPDEHRLSETVCDRYFSRVHYVRDVEESQALGKLRYPHIIISASGMASGGRVLHHLKRVLPNPANAVLFVGHQAGGTRGARLLGGEPEVKIHGKMVRVKAEIALIDGLSAHADYREMLGWLSGSPGLAPKTCFLVHGEEQAIDGLRLRLEEELKWRVTVPSMGQQFVLKSGRAGQ